MQVQITTSPASDPAANSQDNKKTTGWEKTLATLRVITYLVTWGLCGGLAAGELLTTLNMEQQYDSMSYDYDGTRVYHSYGYYSSYSSGGYYEYPSSGPCLDLGNAAIVDIDMVFVLSIAAYSVLISTIIPNIIVHPCIHGCKKRQSNYHRLHKRILRVLNAIWFTFCLVPQIYLITYLPKAKKSLEALKPACPNTAANFDYDNLMDEYNQLNSLCIIGIIVSIIMIITSILIGNFGEPISSKPYRNPSQYHQQPIQQTIVANTSVMLVVGYTEQGEMILAPTSGVQEVPQHQVVVDQRFVKEGQVQGQIVIASNNNSPALPLAKTEPPSAN